MMAAASDEYSSQVTLPTEKREELFTCSICQDRLEDPKDLDCRHSFCKSCLDELLSFNEDGSASISCPMRCDSPTFLEKTKTTNDLKTSYSFKGIVSWLEEQEKASNPDAIRDCSECEEINCTNKMTLFCSTCQLMMCQHCHTSHKVKCACQQTYSLKFDRKTSTIMALCKEHGTYTTSICSCQNKLICIYCTHRQHKQHRYSNIRNIASQIRDKFKMVDDKSNDSKNLNLKNKNAIRETFEKTEAAVNEVRGRIMAALGTRMLKHMNDYFEQLNQIHDGQIKDYEAFMGQHLQIFSGFNENDTKENMKDFTDRPSFVLALNEESLIGSTHCDAAKELILPTYNVRIGQPTTENPLGKIKIDYLKDTSTNDCETTVTSSIQKNDDANEDGGVDEIFDIINQFHALCNKGKAYLSRINHNKDIDETEVDDANAAHSDDGDCSQTENSSQTMRNNQVNNEILSVKILRDTKGRFGFSFQLTNEGFVIQSIKDEERCRELRENDVILTINSNDVQKLQYHEVVEIFKNCSMIQYTDIQVKRKRSEKQKEGPNHPSAPPNTSNSTNHVLTIIRGKRGFGFTIEESVLGPRVKFVRDDRRCFGLQIGDIIVRINSENVRNREFKEVTQLLKDCPINERSVLEIQRYKNK